MFNGWKGVMSAILFYFRRNIFIFRVGRMSNVGLGESYVEQEVI
jgi:hypothetical protein